MATIDSTRFRYGMILRYIDQLSSSFTIQQPVDLEVLQTLNSVQEYTQMIRWIMRCLKLDLRLTVGYVNSGGPTGAAAWIETPDPFPRYGSPAFKNLHLKMYVRKSFLADAPLQAKVLVFAHELSHIVLNATGNPLRHEEPAVDLTAMMLGFRECYVVGAYYEEVPPHVPFWQSPKQYAHHKLIKHGLKRAEIIRKTGYLSPHEIAAANRLIAERTPPA